MNSVRRKGIGKDPEYLEWLRAWPCLVCAFHYGEDFDTLRSEFWRGAVARGYAAAEAAHVGIRGLGQKCPDREAIPLCVSHHRTGKDSHHVKGRAFWEFHGIVRQQVVAQLQAIYDHERTSGSQTGARGLSAEGGTQSLPKR